MRFGRIDVIHTERALVMDVDGTLCEVKTKAQTYLDVAPKADVVAKLKEYRALGFYIILHTSRNMRTYEGNIGKIIANTTRTLVQWLDQHGIPYDEIHVGKPWPGQHGFYVDDRAIRPDEFTRMSFEEIAHMLGNETVRSDA
jgi:capsule biosynthesis phosphatase